MAKMTAAQIRLALKPMADFAPAIMSALDIIESAELAEKALPAIAKEKAKLEGEITDYDKRKGEHEDAARQAKIFLNKTNEDAEKRKAELRAQSAALNDEITAKQQRIAGLDGEYAERKKAKDLEIQVAQKRLDALNAEIDRLRKTFAAA
jgi:chromosome segregation ATPase